MSKGGYGKLLQKFQESLAENRRLHSQIAKLGTSAAEAATSESAQPTAQPSILEKILLFFEHGLFLTAVGIAGPLMVPLSNWFLLLPATCFALAFHRVGVVRGRPWFQQVPSYLLISSIGIATGFGIHVAIEKQENDLLSRLAAMSRPSPPQITNIYEGPGRTPAGSASELQKPLKERTALLAQDLFDWSITRDVERSTVKQQAMAQALISAMKGDKDGDEKFRGRLATWENETTSQFLNFYWPRVIALQDELHAVGADTSSLSRAEASGNPERIALMLSSVAERIGKHPPFPRQITFLQIKAITRDIDSPNVEIYADLEDSNSRQIAETLRKGFSAEKGLSVNKTILPLSTQVPKRHGIWTIYPSADMTTVLNRFITLLDACELESKWEVRPMKQPPTIVKIEVWPANKDWVPPTGPNLLR